MAASRYRWIVSYYTTDGAGGKHRVFTNFDKATAYVNTVMDLRHFKHVTLLRALMME